MYHAHSLEDRPEAAWQPLAEHLLGVAALAERSACKFGAGPAARLAGLLHDLGKYTAAFQGRIRGRREKVDHATAGARMVIELAKAASGRSSPDLFVARIVAHAIAGHHAGLPDSIGPVGALDERLARELPQLDAIWREEITPDVVGLWPDCIELRPERPEAMPRALAFFGRMLFSALVDADFRDTETFYAAAAAEVPNRDWPRLPDVVDGLISRLDAHMSRLAGTASDTPVNRLRGEILAHARAGAEKPTGLFTLSVPTGGGKTLASLAFALDHAQRHGLERIVYAIPFTSVIDQTAKIFRDVLGEEMVLEHHSSIDEETLGEREARDKLRLAMEDWAAPIVVTTNVQLFESLHSHRPSRCRRLHNLARAVIVLDEAQTIPRPVLRPCVAAIDELAARYDTSIVLCTATQPALGLADGFPDGLALDASRELAPDPDRLVAALTRVRLVEGGTMDDDALVAALEVSPQALVIVNSRKHALALFETVRAAGLEGAIHLSTRQHAVDRLGILEDVRARLRDGRPCRVIATSLVEAGVDLDFPRVWRAEAGLDQVLHGGVDRNAGAGQRPPRAVPSPLHGGVDRNFCAAVRRQDIAVATSRGRGSKRRLDRLGAPELASPLHGGVDFSARMIFSGPMSPKRSASDSKTTLLRVRPLPGWPQRGLLLGAGLRLPCALGRSGVTRFKREGDGATPIARMEILSGRRRADRIFPVPAPTPLVPIRADDGWSDDVADARYNRPVRLPVASSHETMKRDDGLYDLVFVLDWNFRRRVIGRGSAIFLHCAKETLEPTSGCVALRPSDMRRLLPRLKRRTVLVVG